MVTNQTLFEV
jgi:hypothetical protein